MGGATGPGSSRGLEPTYNTGYYNGYDRKVRFHLEDQHMDPKSGKPVANVVVYEYEDGPDRYRVSYRRPPAVTA
jgi:hypothetical protein